ncbi:MAG: T9SS type A sorting domain-containing protein, partial [Candidatus Delongbacteria bacterium]|nr:T9SS type A sorting domain-containing protein [Candidatus Delongbacteria bacterium]
SVDVSSIDGNMPLETKLEQNYPNPFNPTTAINFSLATAGNVQMNVYNFSGQLVNSLVDGQMSAGYHTVNFDASNLSAGVYYYTLEADNKVMTNKMVLVK